MLKKITYCMSYSYRVTWNSLAKLHENNFTILEPGCNGREGYFSKDMNLKIKTYQVNTDSSEVSKLCLQLS